MEGSGDMNNGNERRLRAIEDKGRPGKDYVIRVEWVDTVVDAHGIPRDVVCRGTYPPPNFRNVEFDENGDRYIVQYPIEDGSSGGDVQDLGTSTGH